MQLLAHLAVSGAWQGREHVAQLLWPDREPKVARSNLRNLLCKLPAFAAVEATEHALRLKAASDLDELEAALQQRDWNAVVRLGSAELLQGYESAASEPYLQWLRSEREARLGQWKRAVQALLTEPSTPAETRDALAESWAQRCPLDEDAVQARLALAHERGRPGAAARIFRSYATRLRDELGVGPSVELERLALHQPVRPAPPALPNRTLPHVIGRRLELRQLAASCHEAATQLVTITGPGGVGKSTLLAAFLPQWRDEGGSDAFLVDVSAAPDASSAITAVAMALGVTVPPDLSAVEVLADALGDRRWLLLIDGAEQPGLATPLALLLQRCPKTLWLVASRQRLHLEAERLLQLDGFPLPDAGEADPDLLGANDGVRLLADAIAKAGRPVTLQRDAATLAAIVRAVDGLPLALKLLGKLTHLFSLEQLLDSVSPRPVDGVVPADPLRLAELLPSLLASFQRSWMSLSSGEQIVLARLAVFTTDFDIDAGRRVARTELPLITSLVDRSLLRALGAGRFSLHAAIRSCVLALCPLPAEEAVGDFLAHFAARLRALSDLARTRTVRPLQQFVDSERGHLDLAWALALQRRDHGVLLSLQESVWFLDSGVSSAVRFSARCVEVERRVRGDATVPLALRALLRACVARDALNHRRSEAALEHAREAMRLAQRARHFDASLLAVNTWLLASAAERDYPQAERLSQRQEALLQHVDEGVFALWNADARALLAIVMQRDLEAGMAGWARCAALARQVEDTQAEVHGLINIAMSCHRLQAHERAIPFEEQAFALSAAGRLDPASQAKWLSELTFWHLDLGDIERARAYAERAVQLSGSHPQTQLLRLKVRLAQAAVQIARDQLRAARDHLVEVLDALQRDDLPAISGTAFVTVAKWFLSAGQRPWCLEVLHRVLGSRASNFHDTKVAHSMLAELGEAAPAAAPPEGPVARIAMTAAEARQRMLKASLPAARADTVDPPARAGGDRTHAR